LFPQSLLRFPQRASGEPAPPQALLYDRDRARDAETREGRGHNYRLMLGVLTHLETIGTMPVRINR